MFKDIDHILKDRKRSEKLIKDLLSVVKKNTGLMISYENSKPNYVHGIYELKDNLGNIQGNWNIKINIPNKYPFEFPKLIETSQKIKPSQDTHMGVSGEACVELDILTDVIGKNGITISEFLDKYVSRYFSWQVLNSTEHRAELDSWGHEIEGKKQFFFEIINSDEVTFISKCLEIIKSRKFPRRNEQCFCGSRVKYKNCHQRGLIKLASYGVDIIQKHFSEIKKSEDNNLSINI